MVNNLKNNETVENIVNEIKGIDNNVTNVIVPILRDTISDYRKVVNKLIAIVIILVICLASLGIVGYFIISNQIEKYNEFLSQFELESDETYTYTQDLDSGEGRRCYYKFWNNCK